MRIQIAQGMEYIFLEESSQGTIILNLSLKGVTLYTYVSETSNLALIEEKGNCIGIEE